MVYIRNIVTMLICIIFKWKIILMQNSKKFFYKKHPKQFIFLHKVKTHSMFLKNF